MRENDRVQVISGEHKGKTGHVIGPWIATGIGTVKVNDEDIKDRYFVEFEDGSQDILEEKELELIID